MLRVFNCGVGMALVVADPHAAVQVLAEQGEAAVPIGRIEAGEGAARVELTVPDRWLR